MITNYLERQFELTKNGTTIKTELLAGLTTFSTMAYIIFLNPQILSLTGMDFGAVMVATILASVVATLCMAFIANYPFALAPGMGLNAYFTYGIVLEAGHTWQEALGASFLAGLIFLILTLTQVRRKLMHIIPENLRIAIAAGVGLFIAFIGLQNVEVIAPDEVTLVTLGDISSPEAALTGLGIVITTALMTRRIPGAILWSIFITWGIGIACGLVEFQGIVSLPPDPSPVFLQLDILGVLRPAFIPIILSLLFVAIFDAAGTLMTLGSVGGFLDKDKRLPRANRALTNDAIGTTAAGLFGTSPMTTYLESASGMSVGGRTGLTGVTVAILFLLTLFFSPLASSIPAFATAPALIVVGAMMITELEKFDWSDTSELIPAFIIIIAIPFTFSIAIGIALGFITYPLIKLLSGRVKEVHPLIWVVAVLFSLKFFFE